jgi:hypothetical protein
MPLGVPGDRSNCRLDPVCTLCGRGRLTGAACSGARRRIPTAYRKLPKNRPARCERRASPRPPLGRTRCVHPSRRRRLCIPKYSHAASARACQNPLPAENSSESAQAHCEIRNHWLIRCVPFRIRSKPPTKTHGIPAARARAPPNIASSIGVRFKSSDYRRRLPGFRAGFYRPPRTFRAFWLPRRGSRPRPRVRACSRRRGRVPRCHP